MSSQTDILGLSKPDFNDEVEYTINKLADNFQRLDDVAEIYADAPPTSGTFLAKKRIWNDFTSTSEYAGWINIRAGVSAPIWKQSTPYSVGDKVVPHHDNGHYYTCIQSGVAGLVEPIFPVSDGGQVADTRSTNAWISNYFYNLNDLALPLIENGRYYVCIQPGQSGTSEPVWSLSDGTTTYDGNASWRGYRIAKWQESGAAALFRPFGKME